MRFYPVQQQQQSHSGGEMRQCGSCLISLNEIPVRVVKVKAGFHGEKVERCGGFGASTVSSARSS